MTDNKPIKKQKQLTAFFFTICTTLLFNPLAFSQKADFSVDISTGCTPLDVKFTNLSDSAGQTDIIYSWDFGDGVTSTKVNPTHTFNKSGVFTVKLILENPVAGFSDTAKTEIDVSKLINAIFLTPQPPGSVCVNQLVEFNVSAAKKDSVFWDFGDGTTSKDMMSFPKTHTYSQKGTVTVKYIVYNGECSDTTTTEIKIEGPVAEFSVTPDSACKGDDINFKITNLEDVTSFEWDVDEGGYTTTDTNFTYQYTTNRDKTVKLKLTGTTATCELSKTVHIFPVTARIEYATAICAINPISFIDKSSGTGLSYFWDFGDDSTSTKKSLLHAFESPGTYTITHSITNNIGCTDTIRDTIFAPAPPDIQLGQDWYICEGDSVQLEASGGDSISWSPSAGLNDPTSYTPKASPKFTTPYRVEVIDRATKCKSSGEITVEVQAVPDWPAPSPLDTTVIIGDTVIISVDSSGDYKYYWSPDYQVLSCDSCTKFIILPLKNTEYVLELKDDRECYSKEYSVNIGIREEYRIGVPKAFTPNDDGVNDIIYVKGWGIKSLVEFRIYNRWGKEVFFSDNLLSGWDGTVDGKPAPIDTYAYFIKAEMWINETETETVTKNGTFTIIK